MWRQAIGSGLALALLALLLVFSTACSGSSPSGASSTPKASDAAAPVKPAVDGKGSAAPTGPTPPAASATKTQPASESDRLAKGKLIFEKTAGDVGCQHCHGLDAKGVIGPNIRGKTAGAIADALKTVEMMQIVHLDEAEIEAVAAYLQYLESQP